MRSLLGKEGTVTLTTYNLIDGKGFGTLSLSGDGASSQFDQTETAIMITPVEVAEEIPNMENCQASIFSTIAPKGKEDKITSKMAVTNAPEKGEESRAFQKPKIPKEFKPLENKECKTWIDNMGELVNAINVARSKISTVDLSKAKNDLEKAALMEMKEQEESVGVPAWIVLTDKVSNISINDLGISMSANIPFNLGNISAKKIAMSGDLKSLLSERYIKFIAPSERESYLSKVVEAESVGVLEVFDSPDEAEANMRRSKARRDDDTGDEDDEDDEPRKASKMEFTEEELAQPTEEESMIINLTQNLPTKKTTRQVETSQGDSASRHTVHNTQIKQNNPNSAIKPIRKL